MKTKTTTLFDSKAAARRRLIYLACGGVVLACLVAGILIGSAGSGKPTKPGPDKAEAGGGDKPAKPSPDEPDGGPDVPTPVDPPDRPAPVDEPEGLAGAKRLHDRGVELLQEALAAERGSEAAMAARKAAYESLVAARDAYQEYLDENPGAGRSLDRRMTDLTRLLSGIRKDMVLSEIPPGETDGPPRESPPPRATEPNRPEPPRATPPRAVPVERPFLPDQEVKRFQGVLGRAYRDGRPDRILEAGRPLLEDPRMEGHREGIATNVDLAARMEAVLDLARDALSLQKDQEVTLGLRTDSVTGTLLRCDGAIVLGTLDGEKTIHMGDLDSRQILTLVEIGGGVSDPEDRRAIGAFLLLRGDQDAGARELLVASSQGADVSVFEKRLVAIVRRSPDLRALAGYLRLVPELSSPGVRMIEAIEKFKAAHGASKIFLEHREELFQACADAARKHPFELSQLFSVEGKVDKRGVQLVYPFDDPVELSDFGMRDKWVIENGRLLGEKGAVWLQRFDLTNADLRFVQEEAGSILAGFFTGRKRHDVSLKVDVVADQLILTLRHGDRPFATESVPIPRGKVDILIQKRDDKYQVRLNRRVVLKGTDRQGKQGDPHLLCGFAPNGGPVAISEVEIKTALDLDWALAGGTRFSSWVKDWHITGPFSLPGKDMRSSLAMKWWPEDGEIDLAALGGNGKPLWGRVRAEDGSLNLRRYLKPAGPSASYAVARIWAPTKCTAILELQVDDNARAWLNGDVALAIAPLGEAHRATVKLVAGDNLLVLKVLDAGGEWWARARFLGKSGEPMRELQSW